VDKYYSCEDTPGEFIINDTTVICADLLTNNFHWACKHRHYTDLCPSSCGICGSLTVSPTTNSPTRTAAPTIGGYGGVRLWTSFSKTQTGMWDVKDLSFYTTRDCSGSKIPPQGTITESGHHPCCPPERAFDNSDSTIWGGRSSGDNFWIGMEFSISQPIKCVSLLDGTVNYAKLVTVQVSFIGRNSWTNLVEVDGIAGVRQNISVAKDTISPTESPTSDPTKSPTPESTEEPTNQPTMSPTSGPTQSPTQLPTSRPTSDPTSSPECTNRVDYNCADLMKRDCDKLVAKTGRIPRFMCPVKCDSCDDECKNEKGKTFKIGDRNRRYKLTFYLKVNSKKKIYTSCQKITAKQCNKRAFKKKKNKKSNYFVVDQVCRKKCGFCEK